MENVQNNVYYIYSPLIVLVHMLILERTKN
jgi:hypothetical protein